MQLPQPSKRLQSIHDQLCTLWPKRERFGIITRDNNDQRTLELWYTLGQEPIWMINRTGDDPTSGHNYPLDASNETTVAELKSSDQWPFEEYDRGAIGGAAVSKDKLIHLATAIASVGPLKQGLYIYRDRTNRIFCLSVAEIFDLIAKGAAHSTVLNGEEVFSIPTGYWACINP